ELRLNLAPRIRYGQRGIAIGGQKGGLCAELAARARDALWVRNLPPKAVTSGLGLCAAFGEFLRIVCQPQMIVAVSRFPCFFFPLHESGLHAIEMNFVRQPRGVVSPSRKLRTLGRVDMDELVD